MNASVRRSRRSQSRSTSTFSRNDQRRHIGRSVRSVACRRAQQLLGPAMAAAVRGRDRTAVGLGHLHGVDGADAARADASGGPHLPDDQRGDHPAAGRHHRRRSLADGAGETAGTGCGATACADRQPVLDHCRAAGRAGCGRRQRHHRARPRSAVLGSDQGGDRELADHRARLHLRARAADPRRHSRHGQRSLAGAAALRPGPQIVPGVPDGQCRTAQPAGRHADRQGRQGAGDARRPASSRISPARRRTSSATSTTAIRRSRCSPRPITSQR